MARNIQVGYSGDQLDEAAERRKEPERAGRKAAVYGGQNAVHRATGRQAGGSGVCFAATSVAAARNTQYWTITSAFIVLIDIVIGVELRLDWSGFVRANNNNNNINNRCLLNGLQVDVVAALVLVIIRRVMAVECIRSAAAQTSRAKQLLVLSITLAVVGASEEQFLSVLVCLPTASSLSLSLSLSFCRCLRCRAR